jgi:hypothetical protein
VIVGIDRQRIDAGVASSGLSVMTLHVVLAVQQFVVFHTPPPTLPI